MIQHVLQGFGTVYIEGHRRVLEITADILNNVSNNLITFSSLTMSKHRPLSDKELLDLIDQGLSDIEYLSNDEDDDRKSFTVSSTITGDERRRFLPQVHLDPSPSNNQGHRPTSSSPDIDPSRRLLRASTELSTCNPAPETQRSPL
ncbi:hypothetical protein GEV33_009557 [Tenebrio molitor]|uniref:Uncharacterized protein n=1 Tax=Tenebrio molitor TaxID=7067 RepID=A0A8J6L803_TENMO|nr:hypothetical protein GEV33_009557 [Tenebrio molitor]